MRIWILWKIETCNETFVGLLLLSTLLIKNYSHPGDLISNGGFFLWNSRLSGNVRMRVCCSYLHMINMKSMERGSMESMGTWYAINSCICCRQTVNINHFQHRLIYFIYGWMLKLEASEWVNVNTKHQTLNTEQVINNFIL